MKPFYKNPFIRSVIFVPLLIYAASLPWAVYAQSPFMPIHCAIPFAQYVAEKYILPKGENARFQQLLQVFIDVPELRHLAIPPEKGGPKNQLVFVISGFSIILSLALVAFPVSWVQFIGFIVSMSSDFGYVFSMALHESMPIIGLEWGVYVSIAFTLIGLICIVY